MKNILKYSIFTLLMAQLVLFSACLKDDDLVTSNAKTGGLVVPGADVLPYKLGATPTLAVSIDVLAGPAVSKVEVYKQFVNSVTEDASNKILLTTIDISSANASETVTKEFSTTYTELKAGLTVGGVALPAAEGSLNIGDYWELSFVSVMPDGSKAVNGAITIVSVANAYAGKYRCVGYFSHPTPGSSRDIDRTKTLLAVDATTCITELGDLGASGYDIKIKVNPDNTVTVTKGVTSPVDVVMTPGKTSYYDPATKKFYLYYFYVGGNGNRVMNEVYTPL
jgi:hypothetical protein